MENIKVVDTRKVDDLGRIVIAKGIRNLADIKERNELAITYIGDGEITLKKTVSCCSFCASTEDLIDFRNKTVCQKCVQELQAYL